MEQLQPQQFLNNTHMNTHTKLNLYAALVSILVIALSWGLGGASAATTLARSTTSTQTSSSTATSTSPVGGSCTEQDKQLSEITRQVNELQAEKDSVDKAAEIISAEATRFKNLLATSTTATFTATTTATTTPVVTTTNGTSAFSLSVSPTTIHPGDTFTMSVNINSSSVQKYSVSVSQGGSLVGTLLSGATPDSSSRPAYVQKVFQISAGAPVGTYTVKISDDNNSSVFQTATLVVTANQNSYSQAQSNTATTNQTNTTVTTSNGMSALTFANPFAYGILPRDKNTQITWTAQGNTTAPVNLYLKTSCVKNIPICSQNSPNNPTSSCIKIKSSCKTGSSKTVSIGTVPASQGSYNWVIPHSVVDTAGVIYAEQNGQRVGSTGRFYVSY